MTAVKLSGFPAKPLYQILAGLVQARHNCQVSRNDEWFFKHGLRAQALVKRFLPSGSGWDNGTTLDLDRSSGEKLVFTGAFHHMNEHGFYDAWTDHTVTVTGSLLSGINLQISGRNRNQIKDYLHDMFDVALSHTYDECTLLGEMDQ
jgi:hypothetical protein